MLTLHQKVILPKSHNNKDGVVTQVPKQITKQAGLKQAVERVKVAYTDGHGGMTEGWFKIDVLEAWRSPKDITEELEAKHKLEMEKVSGIQEKEKLDWIEKNEEKAEKKELEGDKVIEVTKNTDIIKEMGTVIQSLPTKKDDNSDEFIG